MAPIGGQSTLDLDWWVEHIPGYDRNFHGDGQRGDLSKSEQRALVRELSIIHHISPDDPSTVMSYGMHPEAPIPSYPKRARGWSIHRVNFGIVMEEKHREEGVEVFRKYPKAYVPFENDNAFLMHHFSL